MKVLGIDPGTTRIGYGFISAIRSKMNVLEHGVLEIQAVSKTQRILELGNRFSLLIQKLKPDLAGLEMLYFAKNQKTALSVSEARGMLLYLLMHEKIPVIECRPGDVKLTVAGYGLADKKAVAKMVYATLAIQNIPGHDDITDALAVAITAATRYRTSQLENSA